MTWVFLSKTERNKISRVTGPYIVDCYEPHESAVRQRNPRDDWHGLTEEERQVTVSSMDKPFYVQDLLAAIEVKLQEKNT